MSSIFLKNSKKKLVSLNLAFDSTYFGSNISFFIKGRMETISMMKDNVYLLDFTIQNVPDTYKEIFLYLSNMSSLYKKLYNTKLTKEQESNLKKLPVTKAQIFKDGVLVCHGTVANISTRHLELDLRNNKEELEIDGNYKYIILYYGKAINLSGKIVKSIPNQYISSLDFNLEFIHILSKYMNMGGTNNSDDEELEEI